jgi:hypothetical protein
MPEENIQQTSLETTIPSELEIPKGDTAITTALPPTNATAGKNIFLEENQESNTTETISGDKETEEGNFVSKYIRGFIIASIITVLDIILL